MAGVRKIKAKKFVADVRRRLTDFELMANYELSGDELVRVMERLVDAGSLRPAEIQERGAYFDDPVNRSRTRRYPREYLRIPPIIQDMMEPEEKGLVVDLSEHGFRVRGISGSVGDEKVLLIGVDQTDPSQTAILKARCRWTNLGHDDRRLDESGFEITEVSEKGLKAIRKLILRLSLGDTNIKQRRNMSDD